MNRKYFRAIVVLCAVFLVGIVFVLYHAYEDAVAVAKEHLGDHNLAIAGQAGRSVESEMQTLIEHLEFLSQDPAVRAMDFEKARGVLENSYVHVMKNSVNDIALMDAEGIVRLPLNSPDVKDKDFSFREYYQEARKLKKSVPVYEHIEFKGMDAGRKGIVIAMPVFSGGNFRGVVLFTVKVDELLGRLMPPNKGYIRVWVMDDEGHTLFHPDYPPGTEIAAVPGGSAAFRAFVDRAAKGEDFWAEYVSLTGAARVAAAHSVGVAGKRWAVIVSSPAEEFSSMISGSSMKFSIALALIVLAATGVVVTLNAYNAELEKARRELDARVRARTDELAEANKGLLLENSERRRAEESLRAARIASEREKAKTEAVLAAIGDAVTIVDAGFNIVYQNEAARRLTGGAALGKKCYEAAMHKSGVCEDCQLEKTFADGGTHMAEKKFTVRGATLYREVVSSPIYGPSGEIVAGVEVARDITERKRAEDELRESRNFVETIVEATPT